MPAGALASVAAIPASRESRISTDSACEAPGRKQHVEHDLALGDEAALAADEIALANVAIGGNARIVGVVDRDCCRSRGGHHLA